MREKREKKIAYILEETTVKVKALNRSKLPTSSRWELLRYRAVDLYECSETSALCNLPPGE